MGLETNADVKGETIIKHAFWLDHRPFVSDSEVRVGGESNTEPGADRDLSDAVGPCCAEVKEVVTFAIKREEIATIDDCPSVGENKWDEPAADVVVRLKGVMENAALGGALVRNAQSSVAGEVKVPKSFGCGNEEVLFAVSTSVENVFIASGGDAPDAGSENELVGLIVNERILDP